MRWCIPSRDYWGYYYYYALKSSCPSDKVQAVKHAMAGFSLPASSVPQWAKVVPEDVWKAELIGGLRKQHKRK